MPQPGRPHRDERRCGESHGAAAVIAEVAAASLRLRIGVVLGDDVLDLLDAPDAISANAYLGSEGIVQALDDGADVVVTGRVADAALFAGPLVHAHRWALDDWEHLRPRSRSATSSSAPGR